MGVQDSRYRHYKASDAGAVCKAARKLESLDGYRCRFDFFFWTEKNKVIGIVLDVPDSKVFSDADLVQCEGVLSDFGITRACESIQKKFDSRMLSLSSSAPSTVRDQEKHIRISLPLFTR